MSFVVGEGDWLSFNSSLPSNLLYKTKSVALLSALHLYISGIDWSREDDQDGGPGNVGIIVGFHNRDMEVLVLWRANHTQRNYRWSACYDVRIVGHSDDLHVGDVVERGELYAHTSQSVNHKSI